MTTVTGVMRHSTYDKFFIRFHALHNARRLREVLPQNLTAPVRPPDIADCEEFHHQMARKLQKKNPQKRAKAKQKAMEKRVQRKQAIDEEEGSTGEQGGEEEELCIG